MITVSTSTTDNIVRRVNEIIQTKWRVTTVDGNYRDTGNFSFGSAHEIISVHFVEYREVCVKWVQRLLIDKHKSRRLQASNVHFCIKQ